MAVELAAAYVKLGVEYDSIEDHITKDLSGAQKKVEEAGKKLGKVLSEGLRSPGGSSGSKSIAEDLVKDLTNAEKKIEKAGKDLGDALSKGIRNPQGGKSIAKDLGDTILDGVRKGAKDAGPILKEELGVAANEVAAQIGKKIGDAIGNTAIGKWAVDMADQVRTVVAPLNDVAGAMKAIRDHDAAGAVKGVSDALRDIGKSGAADTVSRIGDKIGDLQTKSGALKDNIAGTVSGFSALTGDSGKIAGGLNAILAAAGPLAAALTVMDAAIPSFHTGVRGVIDQIQGKKGFEVKDWAHTFNPITGVIDDYVLPRLGIKPPFTRTPPQPRGPSVVDRGTLGPVISIPGIAGGGIVSGPGTGTSDSILARLSVGEGIVKNDAMAKGGGPLVAALNAGWVPSASFLKGIVPGFDEGAPVDPMMARWFNALQSGRLQPGAQLPMGVGAEGGLQQNTIIGKRMISALFPEIGEIGGYRQDSLRWHPEGLAVDIMIPGGDTSGGANPSGRALGDQINAFLKQNAAALGIDYTMWQQTGHYNHIHANFGASGFPQQGQQFMLPPALQGMLGLAGNQNGVSLATAGAPGESPLRTQGLIPAGAGASGQMGTSFASGLYGLAASVINNVIDQAAQAAIQGVSMAAAGAAAGGSMGAGAPAAPAAGAAAGEAAQFAIGIGADLAKQGVSYGFQMAGIWTDAVPEILLPFGVPRFFSTDAAQFIPQIPNMPTAQTTGEKALQPGADAGGPVQPNQLPGMQPFGPTVTQNKPGQPGPAPLPIPGLGTVTKSLMPVPGVNVVTPAVGQPAPGAANVHTTGIPQIPEPGKPVDPAWSNYLQGIGTFDTGGWLMPKELGFNAGNRPEPIFSPEEFGNIAAIANQEPGQLDRSRGSVNDYRVMIGNLTVKDVNELQRQLTDRQNLQKMRYAGRSSMGGA